MKSNMHGIYPPVITIFNAKGKIDIEENKKQADFLIAQGVDGINLLGTNGEFSSISLEDKKILIKEMISHTKARIKVLVGAGDTCVDRVLEIIAYSEEQGADGILLINPYYTVYDDDMIVNYYTTIAKQTSLPIIIYNFPILTGYNFQPIVVERIISASSNIIGIKNTYNDLSHLYKINQVKNKYPDFIIYAAFENQFLPALTMGIDSFINATATFAPEFTVGLKKAYQNKDFDKAMQHYQNLLNVMTIYELANPLLLACKEAVYQRVLKIENTYEKLPALGLTKEKQQQIQTILKNLNLT